MELLKCPAWKLPVLPLEHLQSFIQRLSNVCQCFLRAALTLTQSHSLFSPFLSNTPELFLLSRLFNFKKTTFRRCSFSNLRPTADDLWSPP